MAITAADVKKLREHTGAGMMDCKKALEEAEGDFDKATELLRIKLGKKAAARGADVVVLGREMADKLYGTANPVGQRLMLMGFPFTVVGVADKWKMLPRVYLLQGGSPYGSGEEFFIPLSARGGCAPRGRRTSRCGSRCPRRCRPRRGRVDRGRTAPRRAARGSG